MFLEITAEGWIAIIAAIGAQVVVIGGVITSIILAWRNSQKQDAAAERREVIAQAVLDPNVTTLPPAPPKG